MIKEKDNIVLSITILLLLTVVNAPCDISGWLEGGFKTTNNVYSDSRQLSDTGCSLSGALSLKTKFAKNMLFKLNYNLDAGGYFTQNYENEIFNSINASLKYFAVDSFEINLDGNFDYSILPNATIYNNYDIGFKPSLKWYIFDHTTITGSYIYDDIRYSEYNLDNKGNGGAIKIVQELSLYTCVEGMYKYKTMDYSEKYLYESVSGGIPTYKSVLRRDVEKTLEVLLSQVISIDVSIDLIYRNIIFDSNDNFLDFGPNQTETLNTIIGDERIITDYRSYISNCGEIKMKITPKDSLIVFSIFYTQKKYSGRLAKDETDKIKQPDEKRHDNQMVISGTWTFPVSEEVSLKLACIYDTCDSNDLLYKYNKFTLGAFLSTGF